MVYVYGIPNCDKIKKTKSLLDKEKIEYTFVNVRIAPIDKEKLSAVVSQLGLDTVLNRKGMMYRKLGLKDKNYTDDQLFNALLNEQRLIKRPLIENKNKFHSGYDETVILEFVK